MKRIFALLCALLMLFGASVAKAYDTNVNLVINSSLVKLAFPALLRDGVTYIDAKGLCEKLGLSYKEYPGHGSVVISNNRHSICLVPGEKYATVADLTGKTDHEYIYRLLSAPCIYINGHLAVTARDMASVFCYELSYVKDKNTVYFGYSPEMISDAAKAAVASKAYYFQNQAEFMLPSNGSGYCWASSYAMLISNLTSSRVTTPDIANINLNFSQSGAYCYHSEIVKAYGLKFVSALSPDSPYYDGRDSVSGGTYIKNPYKSDAVIIAALKEALLLHPEGVIVRYSDYPHSMVAVYDDSGIILFNDPAPTSSSSYSETGKYQGVPFSETCVAKKGFLLSDVTFIQAIGYN